MAKAKKRNPQDATLRNVRAARKEIRELREALKALEARFDAHLLHKLVEVAPDSTPVKEDY